VEYLKSTTMDSGEQWALESLTVQLPESCAARLASTNIQTTTSVENVKQEGY